MFALAGPRQAVAIFYLKQGPVSGALNQCTVSIEESVLLPFQRCAQVGASVPVKIDLLIFFYYEQIEVIHLQSPGSTLFDIIYAD